MELQSVFLALAMVISATVAGAQTLEAFGSVPQVFRGGTVTLFFEGDCDHRLIPATFIAFKDAGYQVHVDGERRPQSGGLVLTATVGDTTFTRRGSNPLVRSIHENELTDLVVTINGNSSYINIRQIFLNIIDRRTGQLLQSISCRQRNVSLGYDRYSEELFYLLAPEAAASQPSE